MPDELRQQLEPIHALVKAMGLPLLHIRGVEADDVIGTLSDQAAADGLEVLISTGDKDMTQLVGPNVTCVNTMDGAVMDIAGVQQKFGVPPERIVDYLALIGDSVDNVPGIPKVGPKTAVKWLEAFGDVDGVVANAESIKGKVGENLRANLEQLALSRELVTIKRDVELELGPRDLKCKTPDLATLRELYTELEFKTWLGELAVREDAPPEPEEQDIAVNYETILTMEYDSGLPVSAAPLLAFDTETTSLNICALSWWCRLR